MDSGDAFAEHEWVAIVERGRASPASAEENRFVPRGGMGILEIARERTAEGKPELGITDLANALNLSASTVHRVVRALTAGGFLRQNPHSGRYYLGRTASLLGQVAQHNFGLDRVLPILERMTAQTGESINFGVQDGAMAVVLLRVESTQSLRFEQPPGTRVPLHCSAMGKALLAFDGDTEFDVSELNLFPRTPGTITSPREFERELRKTRFRGYSIDNEEAFPGVRCVGVPVVTRDGYAFAAIAMQAPSVRMSMKRIKELAPLVVGAAHEIADLLSPQTRF